MFDSKYNDNNTISVKNVIGHCIQLQHWLVLTINWIYFKSSHYRTLYFHGIHTTHASCLRNTRPFPKKYSFLSFADWLFLLLFKIILWLKITQALAFLDLLGNKHKHMQRNYEFSYLFYSVISYLLNSNQIINIST